MATKSKPAVIQVRGPSNPALAAFKAKIAAEEAAAAKAVKPATKTPVKVKAKQAPAQAIAVRVPQAAKKLLADTKAELQIHGKNPDKDGTTSDHNVSVFEKKLVRIRKSAEQHDWGEQTQLLIYKSMLNMLLDLIPVAERSYRKTQHHLGAYAITNYLNAAREVANDMRAISSLGQQLNDIIGIVRQQFVAIAQFSLDSLYQIRKELTADLEGKQKTKVETRLEEFGRSQAKYLSESVKMLQESLGEFLLEKPSKKE